MDMDSEHLPPPPTSSEIITQVVQESEITTNIAPVPSRKYEQCRKCARIVSSGGRKRHIYGYHLSVNSFHCPYCAYERRYNKHDVLCHIRTEHPFKPQVVRDVRTNHREEIDSLMAECFAEKSDHQWELTPLPPTPDNLLQCRLCTKMVKRGNRGQHIYTHMINSAFECPYCEMGANRSTTIRNHIIKKHPGMPAKVKNLRRRHSGEIRKLDEECFGVGADLEMEAVAESSGIGVEIEDDAFMNDHLHSMIEIDNQVKPAIIKVEVDDDEDYDNSSVKQKTDNTQPRSIFDKTEKIDFKRPCSPSTSFLEEQNSDKRAADVLTCRLCKKKVGHRYKSAHIYTHMENKAFGCPYCEFETATRANVKRHIKNVHPGMSIRVDDLRNRYTAEIRKLGDDCFGGAMNVSECFERTIVFQPGSAARKCGRLRCSLCQKDVDKRHRVRHIYSHMKRHAFPCEYCDVGCVEITNLRRHIKLKHPGMPVKVTDLREECIEEIVRLGQECFGNRDDDDMDWNTNLADFEEYDLPTLVKIESRSEFLKSLTKKPDLAD